jgi:phosphohistidine phosphatase
MRELLLLRHAKSAGKDDPALTDHERPLAPRGERACAAMAGHLQGTEVDLVLCSTARRAVDTWEGVNEGVKAGEVCFEDALYTFDGADLIDRLDLLRDAVTSVMVVGHNPAIEELAEWLTGEGVEKYPTGALATIALDRGWQDLEQGCAELRAFVRPKDL